MHLSPFIKIWLDQDVHLAILWSSVSRRFATHTEPPWGRQIHKNVHVMINRINARDAPVDAHMYVCMCIFHGNLPLSSSGTCCYVLQVQANSMYLHSSVQSSWWWQWHVSAICASVNYRFLHFFQEWEHVMDDFSLGRIGARSVDTDHSSTKALWV